MPDELRSPIKHHLVLHRIDPEQRIRRFYSLMIERDLFGTVRLVRNWGRIGSNGQELVEIHADEIAPGAQLGAGSAPTGRSWWRCSPTRSRPRRRWRRWRNSSVGAAIEICESCFGKKKAPACHGRSEVRPVGAK
jgi:hypothetical protein